ncbi:glycosyltransferase [Sphingobacterium faecium]|uniref:glycosyltransferase n=1 Tax=Sphingobacterium faecium TaxID=34087 RepID=UPI00320794DC
MDRGGAETMIMNLFRHIDKDIKFDFLVFSNVPGDYDAEIIKLGGNIIPLISKNPLTRSFLLFKYLKDHPEYQIVHSHTLLSSGIHLWMAKLAGVRSRIAHSHSTNYGKGFLNNIYRKLAVSLINRYATHAIACGALASKFLFHSRSDVKILPNAIDTHKLAALESEKDYNINLFESKKLNIIQVGRLELVKNHIFTINFASYLKDKGFDFKIYFVGKGSLATDLKKLVDKKELVNNIQFMGLRDDIPQLMANADFMIIPSLYEGFPLVLVESQSVGLKTIASDKVSKEVDLGFNLIKFVSLESDFSTWETELLNWRDEKVLNKEERLSRLDDLGFNVVKNIKEMANFYKSIENV